VASVPQPLPEGQPLEGGPGHLADGGGGLRRVHSAVRERRACAERRHLLHWLRVCRGAVTR
jgi:hypothetical protein